MEKKGIYARFFGNYGLKYGDEQLILEHSSTSKTAQLLQMLLYFHKTGIPQYRLLENLVGQEERANPINNLKGALSRLRKLLGETILPDMECIVAQNGIYSWTQEIPVTTDVEEFEQLLDQADNTVMDDDKALELRVQACDLYKGELLPQLINLEWVSVENTRLKERYDQTVRYVCAQLTAKGEIRRALELYEKAATVYPFEEEWQVGRLDCMLNLGQHKNALQVYQDVVDANYRNLGISPSEEMQDCFRRIREGAAWGFSSVQEVQKNLMESHIGGAYFCSYPCFASVYQMVRRLIGRNGQSAYLILCSVCDVHGMPIKNEERTAAAVEAAIAVIKKNLRSSDIFTQYGANQLLVLLIGTNMENCSLVFDRLEKAFRQEKAAYGCKMNFTLKSVYEEADEKQKSGS